jgi:CRP-like cAMP-binding protein
MNVPTRLLKRSPLFAGLNEKDFGKLMAIASLRQFRKGEILFSDCEEPNGFYVVVSGKVKLFKVSPEGKEQIILVVSAPDTFAEASLFLHGSYPLFAQTLNDCQLLFFPKRDFLRLKNVQLSSNMIVTLSHYVKRFSSLIEDLSLKEISSRTAKYLLDLSMEQSKEGRAAKEVELDLNRSQLALRLGTIRETVSRTLTKMKAKGIIDIKKNWIVIQNREA